MAPALAAVLIYSALGIPLVNSGKTTDYHFTVKGVANALLSLLQQRLHFGLGSRLGSPLQPVDSGVESLNGLAVAAQFIRQAFDRVLLRDEFGPFF